MLKLLVAATAAVTLAGCMVVDAVSQAGPSVKGSGTAKTETRDVPAFTHIAVQGAMDCDIAVGGKQSVSITSDDNLISHIKTEVKGDTLIIGFKDNSSTSTKLGFKATITVPKLNGFDLAGSGNTTITNVSSASFIASISGSGGIDLSGSADAFSVSIAGAGDVHAKSLKTKSSQVSISGSGNIQVAVQDRLDANIAGSGSIRYFGDPKVSKSIVGSGDISRG